MYNDTDEAPQICPGKDIMTKIATPCSCPRIHADGELQAPWWSTPRVENWQTVGLGAGSSHIIVGSTGTGKQLVY